MRAFFCCSAVLVALLATGCTSARPVTSQCSFSSECAAGLVCAAGFCRVACVMDRDCKTGESCAGPAGSKACVTPDAPRGCELPSDCAVGQTCGPDAVCRAQCRTDYDCQLYGSDSLCNASGACVAPPPPPSPCGNGRIDPGELCDGAAVQRSCLNDGFDSGTMGCAADCLAHDTSRCRLATYTRVFASGTHTCALDTDNAVTCWGYDPDGSLGAFTTATDLVLGDALTCARATNGSWTCRGPGVPASLPTFNDGQLYASGGLLCHRSALGVACFGTSPPVTPLTPVGLLAVDDGRLCWTSTTDGTISCGDGMAPTVMTGSAGSWTELVMGDVVCGVQDTTGANAVRCWNALTGAPATVPTEAGRVRRVDVVATIVCVLWDSGNLACQDVGTGQPVASVVGNGPFVDVVDARERLCVVTGGGDLKCAQKVYSGAPDGNTSGQLMSPTARYTQIAVDDSGSNGCAVRVDGSILCFGFGGQITASPGDVFVKAAVNGSTRCGLTTAGAVRCATPFTTIFPPASGVKDLAIGSSFVCTLDLAGLLTCQGGEPPIGIPTDVAFSAITAAASYVCGIRESDGQLACFSATGPDSPLGTEGVAHTDAAQAYGCSLRAADGTIVCGGTPLSAPPPTGAFTRIGCGDGLACALRDDETLACWGMAPTVPSSPRRYVELAAGGDLMGLSQSVCAITPAGILDCYGLFRVGRHP